MPLIRPTLHPRACLKDDESPDPDNLELVDCHFVIEPPIIHQVSLVQTGEQGSGDDTTCSSVT
jgi:hypothetical protein